MKLRMSEPLRWTLRTALMFFAGVIPAILVFVLTLVLLPLAGIAFGMVVSFSILAALALLGIAGLWTATFRDHQERCVPNAVTVALILCGLVAAVPGLMSMAPEAVAEGGLSLVVTVCLIGPVMCSIYFFLEQLVAAVRRRSAESCLRP